ncbi:MAG TPA: hypothetical protein VHE58_02130 [Burkholderiales bacterium]|nr:hypothetical protein [Burkholderiales bacterium]
MVDRLEKADRLAAITQRVGFAVWQLQELEWAAVNYLVMRVHAKRGMGVAAGEALLGAVGKRTFGSVLKELSGAGVLDPTLAAGLTNTLQERNWLVHQSRRDSRGALKSDKDSADLIARLDKIADNALVLLRQVGQLIERYAADSGVPPEFVDRESERLLKQWGILE